MRQFFIGQHVEFQVDVLTKRGLVVATGVCDTVPTREEMEKKHMPPETVSVRALDSYTPLILPLRLADLALKEVKRT